MEEIILHKDMNKLVIFAFFLAVATQTVSTIQIIQSASSISVQNGSSHGVILDCPYELSDNDSHGLEVKWYLNDKPRPVYQWIPGIKPQDIGPLSGRLDLSYIVSVDKYKKYRALAISDPTSDLSGKYTCWVSNFATEKRVEVVLTVYSPASDFYITYDKMNHDSVTITCSADGLFPQPKLALYRMVPTSGTYKLEESKQLLEFVSENGTYAISLERRFQHMNLEEENEFLCSLTIPNTEYQLDRDLSYSPAAGTGSSFGKLDARVLFVALGTFLWGSQITRS